MKNKGLIIGGLILLTGIGVGVYIYKKNKSAKSSSGERGKTNEADFNDLMDTAKKNGKDIFDGTPEQVSVLKSNFLKNMVKTEYFELKTILAKKEADMTDAEKTRFAELWKKISGK